MKSKYIIGGALVVIAIVFILYSFQSTLTPYVSIEEAKKNPGRVQIAGYLERNSFKHSRQTNKMEFIISEPDGDVLNVIYSGYKLTNLDDAEKVVVIGSYEESTNQFNADEVLVKCPSKYEGRLEN